MSPNTNMRDLLTSLDRPHTTSIVPYRARLHTMNQKALFPLLPQRPRLAPYHLKISNTQCLQSTHKSKCFQFSVPTPNGRGSEQLQPHSPSAASRPCCPILQ